MREIKFRGQRIRPEGVIEAWACGSLIQRIDATEIHDGIFTWNVQPETVGQFTGLTDKNRKEIYEGDIVKVHIERADFVTVVTWGKNSRGWKLKCDRRNINRWGSIKYYSLPSSERIEIIGNIHDNPELIK